MTESALVREIRLEAPKLGVTLFRNSVGMYRDGKGNVIRYGLAVGSSDLIGWFNDPSSGACGECAVFVAIEAKAPGKKATPEQLAFIAAVKRAGGIAGVVYSLDEFRQLIANG